MRPAGLVAVAAAAVAALAVVLGGVVTSSQRAIAEAINLRPGDLPGFSARPADHSAAGRQINSRLRTCVGGGGVGEQTGAVHVSSPQFRSGAGLAAEQVGSDVTVERSSGIVARDLAFIRNGRIQTCLTRAFEGLTFATSSGAPVTISGVQVAPLKAAARGSDGSFGMRASMSMTALGVHVPVTMDLLGYAVGRDKLSLMTFAIARPFQAEVEQRLSSLLISRALAYPH